MCPGDTRKDLAVSEEFASLSSTPLQSSSSKEDRGYSVTRAKGPDYKFFPYAAIDEDPDGCWSP